MKGFAIVLLSISLFSFGLARAQTQFVIEVKGLSCPFCAYGLEKKLAKLEGVARVSIDLDRNQALVTIQPGKTVTEDALRKAVKAAGFSVESIKKQNSEEPQSGSRASRSIQGFQA